MAKNKKGIFQRIIEKVGSIFSKSNKNGKKEPSRTVPEPFRTVPEPSQMNSSEIEDLKARLQPIIDEGNKRWNRLDELELRSLAISRALYENDGKKGFDVSQLTTIGEILGEVTRARVFLNDRTSLSQGAELYTQEESYKQYLGQFGRKYNNWENNFKNFNTKTISEDMARVAFAAYRRLEETEAARIMAYGSENMIAAMYDMVVQQGYHDPNNIDDITDITESARDLLSRQLGEKRMEFERAFKEANEVGYILDIVKAEKRGDYFNDGMW